MFKGRISLLALAANLGSVVLAQDEAKQYTVANDGFCLGMSEMIGEPGQYVQSDYLYAVEVSKFISKYGV
jgi:hypothetical protein